MALRGVAGRSSGGQAALRAVGGMKAGPGRIEALRLAAKAAAIGQVVVPQVFGGQSVGATGPPNAASSGWASAYEMGITGTLSTVFAS